MNVDKMRRARDRVAERTRPGAYQIERPSRVLTDEQAARLREAMRIFVQSMDGKPYFWGRWLP